VKRAVLEEKLREAYMAGVCAGLRGEDKTSWSAWLEKWRAERMRPVPYSIGSRTSGRRQRRTGVRKS